jgi:hypothetical protein
LTWRHWDADRRDLYSATPGACSKEAPPPEGVGLVAALFVGGIAAMNYYPFKLPALRLSAGMVQRKGDRSFILFARGQF